MTDNTILQLQPNGSIVGYVDDQEKYYICRHHPYYTSLREAYDAGDLVNFMKIYNENMMDFKATKLHDIPQ